GTPPRSPGGRFGCGVGQFPPRPAGIGRDPARAASPPGPPARGDPAPGPAPAPGHAGPGTPPGSRTTSRPPASSAWPTALPLLLCLSPRRLLAGPPHSRHSAHHLAHHLLAFEEPHDEGADLADRDAGAGADPSPPRPVDELRVAPLFRRHRVDDGRRPVQVLIADLAEELPVLRGARQHSQQVADRP